jgi:hypothetical protein
MTRFAPALFAILRLAGLGTGPAWAQANYGPASVAPGAEGQWSMCAFMFSPAQVVVHQGERVALSFVDVQGPSFRIAVDGLAEPIAIRRGQIRTVVLEAARPGRITYRALDQQPSMSGEVLVLPRWERRARP